MTRNTFRRWSLALTVLGWLLLGPSFADRVLAQGVSCSTPSPTCVPLTLTANLQLTNLHSAVSHVGLLCKAALPNSTEQANWSGPLAVVNRGYTGSVTVTVLIPAFLMADPARRTWTATCELRLTSGTSTKTAVASAAQPVGILFDNWEVVSAGSTVKWTQAVTFPNANPAP